jgi:DNA-binding transcriptional LysR family regulator
MNAPMEDMVLFARLVELKSFSAVAVSERISRSLVSKRITRLEERLGVQLINRTTRRVEVTDVGRTFYEYCRQMEATWLEAEAAVGEIRSRPRGTLRLNAPVTFGQFVLPRVIGGFLAEYPEVHIVLELRDSFVDIIEGGYDLVIRIGQLKDSSLRARQLGTTRMHLYAHRDYLARHGTPRRPQELAGHNCLVYRHKSGDPYLWDFEAADGSREEIEVRGNLSADNGAPLYQAALAGLGIARLPSFYELAYTLEGMSYVLEDYAVTRGVYAVYPAARRLPLTTRCFIDYLSDHLTSM